MAIVGGGTAGLACANRLLQLLAEDPALLESLGEVPVAVIEKAKTCGGHNLSGAVMRPEPLERLFPDMSREDWRREGFAFGEVDKEAVYLTPTARSAPEDPHAAAVQEPRQRGDLGVGAGALPAAGWPRRRVPTSSPRPRPPSWWSRTAQVEGGAHRRQGPGQGGRAEGQLRARHRHQGARPPCCPRVAGATSPARPSASSTSAATASPRPGSSA